ncbi:P68 family surface lipoprotein [Mesomycoplasma bovoculi]|uniref:Putative lipoprotein n=1 Tax=Mesomycoplasma bovoculi M165/69 TaxID=743966 RepID=W5UTW3_9BACT|nr:P80 family lipoprotein [Mesomycoplasma bovoculi]AHH45536.1 putative lipoprotein [Mesomycoplasma bovoculi M165/69]
MNLSKLKKSKILLPLGSAIGLGSLLVSCGVGSNNSTKTIGDKFAFDTNDDNKLIFGHSFSSSGNETKALTEIVKQWNQTAKNLPGFLPMELLPFAGGYNGATQNIQTFLKSQDKSKIPNIVTNYPSLLAIVNSNEMALPIVHDFKSGTASGSEAEKQLYNTLKEDGIDAFLNYNSEIPLLDSKGIYSLPFAKSSQILSIDKMVLAYIVDKAMNDTTPATIASGDKLFTEISQIKSSNSKYSADLAEVAKIWKEYTSVPESQGGLAGYQFNSQIFDNYEQMVDFADRVVKSFPNSVTQGSDLTRAKAVFGIDNAATSFFSMVAGYNNGDKSKAISVLKGDRVDYKSYWNDKSSPRYQAFKAAYDLLDKGINNKSLYIGGAGEYNSLYLKNHQEAFFIGSSAGYKYNFFPKGKTQFLVKYTDSAGNQKTTTSLDAKYAAIIDKNTTFKKLEEKTSKNGTKYTSYTISGPSGKGKKIAEETKTQLEEMIKTIGDKSYLLFTAASAPKDIDPKTIEKLNAPDSFKYLPFLLKTYISSEQQNTSSKLNEDEMETLAGPEKFDSNSQKNSIVSQGADLIAIHANKKEDEAVRVFLNWLLNTKVEFGQGQQLTPIEYWVQQTSYIAPYKSTFENKAFANDSNAGKRITWTEFNKFLSTDNANNKYQLIYDTADASSAKFRDGLGTTMSAVLSKAQSGEKVDFDQFLEELGKNLGPKFK